MKHFQIHIRPEDLRIGNYVLIPDQYVDSYFPIVGVTATSVYMTSGKMRFSHKLWVIRPIPLTKDILTSWCGFISEKGCAELKKDKLKVVFDDECCTATVHFGRCCRHIKALHELQNIYYAVMGKDMVVTPDCQLVRKGSLPSLDLDAEMQKNIEKLAEIERLRGEK